MMMRSDDVRSVLLEQVGTQTWDPELPLFPSRHQLFSLKHEDIRPGMSSEEKTGI